MMTDVRMGGELQDLLAEFAPDELQQLQNRLATRAKSRQLSSYHRLLLDRINGASEEPVEYPEYKLLASLHFQITKEASEQAIVEHKQRVEEAKALGLPIPMPRGPALKRFEKGDVLKPQNDGEALMMLQDPGKFQPLHANKEHATIRNLEAENKAKDEEIARLREQLAQKES